MPASPICEVKNGSAAWSTTVDGVDVTASETISIRLADTTDVVSWYLKITGTDEQISVTPSLTDVDPVTHLVTTPSSTPTFTAPATLGHALLFESTIVTALQTITTTFIVHVPLASGLRVGAVGETRESSVSYGWAKTFNEALRSLAGGGFSAGGDLSGSSSNQTVVGLQGRTLASTAPTNGQAIIWDGSAWVPTDIPTGFTAAGDLSGDASSQTVVGIQGTDVSSTAPTNGQALVYNGSVWVPGNAFTAGGDLSGTTTNQVVIRIQGNSVSSAMPTNGQALLWDGSAWVPSDIPAGFTAGGDLSGTSSNQTVVGIQGVGVSSTAPTTGQSLIYNGTSWAPAAAYTASGDLTGDSSSQTVMGIQGRSVASTAPSSGDVYQWDGSTWTPSTITTFTAGGDLSGTISEQTVEKVHGMPAQVSTDASLDDVLRVEDGSPTAKRPRELASDGSYLYLGENSASSDTPFLRKIHVASDKRMTVIAQVDLSLIDSNVTGIVEINVDSNYVYAATDAHNVCVLNKSDLSVYGWAFVDIGGTSSTGNGADIWGIATNGTYLYVTGVDNVGSGSTGIHRYPIASIAGKGPTEYLGDTFMAYSGVKGIDCAVGYVFVAYDSGLAKIDEDLTTTVDSDTAHNYNEVAYVLGYIWSSDSSNHQINKTDPSNLSNVVVTNIGYKLWSIARGFTAGPDENGNPNQRVWIGSQLANDELFIIDPTTDANVHVQASGGFVTDGFTRVATLNNVVWTGVNAEADTAHASYWYAEGSGGSYSIHEAPVNPMLQYVPGFIAAGDLTGLATSQTVVGLQGRSVATTAPTNGQRLTWDGSAWAPADATEAFSAGGDLSGSTTEQTVVGLQTAPLDALSKATSNNYVRITDLTQIFTYCVRILSDASYLYVLADDGTYDGMNPPTMYMWKLQVQAGGILKTVASVNLSDILHTTDIYDFALDSTYLYVPAYGTSDVVILNKSDLTEAGWAYTGSSNLTCYHDICVDGSDALFTLVKDKTTGQVDLQKHSISSCLGQAKGTVNPSATLSNVAANNYLFYGNGKIWHTGEWSSPNLERIDPAGMSIEASADVGTNPVRTLYANSTLYVCDNGALLDVDPSTLAVNHTVQLFDGSQMALDVVLGPDASGTTDQRLHVVVDNKGVSIVNPTTSTEETTLVQGTKPKPVDLARMGTTLWVLDTGISSGIWREYPDAGSFQTDLPGKDWAFKYKTGFTAGGDLSGTETIQTLVKYNGVSIEDINSAAHGEIFQYSNPELANQSTRITWCSNDWKYYISNEYSPYIFPMDPFGTLDDPIDLRTLVNDQSASGAYEIWADGASRIWIAVKGFNHVIRYDLGSKTVDKYAYIQATPTDFKIDGNNLYVIAQDWDNTGGVLGVQKFDITTIANTPNTTTYSAIYNAPLGVEKLALGDGYLWVISTKWESGSHNVYKVDPSTMTLDQDSGDVGVTLYDIEELNSTIWLATAQGTCVMLTNSMSITDTGVTPSSNAIEITHNATGSDWIWVGGDESKLYGIDPATPNAIAVTMSDPDGTETYYGSATYDSSPSRITVVIGSGPEYGTHIYEMDSPSAPSNKVPFNEKKIIFAPSMSPGGDLSGDTSSQTVIGIQSNPVSNTAPSTNDVYTWDGSNFVPQGAVKGATDASLVVSNNGYPTGLVGTKTGQSAIWNGSAWTAADALPLGDSYDVLLNDGSDWTAHTPLAGVVKVALGTTLSKGDLVQLDIDRTGASSTRYAYPLTHTQSLDRINYVQITVGSWRAGSPLIGKYEFDACAVRPNVIFIVWTETNDLHVRVVVWDYDTATNQWSLNSSTPSDTVIYTGSNPITSIQVVASINGEFGAENTALVGFIEQAGATTGEGYLRFIGVSYTTPSANPTYGTVVTVEDGSGSAYTDVTDFGMGIERNNTNTDLNVKMFAQHTADAGKGYGYGFIRVNTSNTVTVTNDIFREFNFGNSDTNPECIVVKDIGVFSSMHTHTFGIIYGSKKRGVDFYSGGTKHDHLFSSPKGAVWTTSGSYRTGTNTDPSFGDFIGNVWVNIYESESPAGVMVLSSGSLHYGIPTPKITDIIPMSTTTDWGLTMTTVKHIGGSAFAWVARGTSSWGYDISNPSTTQAHPLLLGSGRVEQHGEISISPGDLLGEDLGFTNNRLHYATTTDKYIRTPIVPLGDNRFAVVFSALSWDNSSEQNANGFAMFQYFGNGVTLGILEEDGNAGDIRNVTIAGGITQAYNWLQAGQRYYLSEDGYVVTDVTPIPLGTALSSTKLLLDGLKRFA